VRRKFLGLVNNVIFEAIDSDFQMIFVVRTRVRFTS